VPIREGYAHLCELLRDSVNDLLLLFERTKLAGIPGRFRHFVRLLQDADPWRVDRTKPQILESEPTRKCDAFSAFMPVLQFPVAHDRRLAFCAVGQRILPLTSIFPSRRRGTSSFCQRRC